LDQQPHSFATASAASAAALRDVISRAGEEGEGPGSASARGKSTVFAATSPCDLIDAQGPAEPLVGPWADEPVGQLQQQQLLLLLPGGRRRVVAPEVERTDGGDDVNGDDDDMETCMMPLEYSALLSPPALTTPSRRPTHGSFLQ
jgi:hypothetical protein